MTDYISREAALEMLDGIYDCNDMVFRDNDSCFGLDCGSCRWRDTRDYIRDRLTRIPAAGVVARDCYNRLLAENDELRKERPVRSGRWEKRMERRKGDGYEAYTPVWRCSVCGVDYDPATALIVNYCRNCGARMDGAEPPKEGK